MTDLDVLLDRMEELLAAVEASDEQTRAVVFELLDGVDALHRFALRHLAEAADQEVLARLRQAHPAVAWLFDAYAIGVDERAQAESALEQIRPYIDSHGGQLEVLEVSGGIVRVRMSGACSGCTASAVTAREGIEEALREEWPGFVALEVEPDDAAPHPPPTTPSAPLLQIGSRPPDA